MNPMSFLLRRGAATRVQHSLRMLAITAMTVVLVGCATAQPRMDDPLESYNRKVYAFNDKLDKAVIRPAAVGYRKVTTPTARRLINNFFANVRMPITIANNLLQGRPIMALRNTGRFAINTTVGFVGLFDPASQMKLPPVHTDFGVTLARWGVPEGPYLVVPFLGPSSARDVWRTPVDTYFFDPLAWYAREHDHKLHAQHLPGMMYLITLRARGLDAEALLDGVYDPYVFFRDAYRQRRVHDIYDGQPPIEVIEMLQGGDDLDLDLDSLLDEQREYEREHSIEPQPAGS